FPPLPDAIAELCRRELALSSLIVDASVTGDRKLALQALTLDPMVRDLDTARAILDSLLREFEPYLPQFAYRTGVKLYEEGFCDRVHRQRGHERVRADREGRVGRHARRHQCDYRHRE
ncbi:MAG: hypothetical protein KC519_12385, partial [Anaerolineae bacterium]|nr:hypothetical protein [Anaerolineae bacterium]